MERLASLATEFKILSKECAKSLLLDFNFSNIDCIKQLISKMLGYLIIVGSCILKVPQILKILKGGIKGLSLMMFFIEFLVFATSGIHGYRMELPFSTYGESFIVLAQIIVILILMFNISWGVSGLLGFFAFAGGYLFANLFMPMQYLDMLRFFNVFLGSSRFIPQIAKIFKDKSIGQLDPIGIFLGFVGSLARIFTTLQEVNDNIILLGYILGVVLSGIILIQTFIYSGGGEKVKAD